MVHLESIHCSQVCGHIACTACAIIINVSRETPTLQTRDNDNCLDITDVSLESELVTAGNEFVSVRLVIQRNTLPPFCFVVKIAWELKANHELLHCLKPTLANQKAWCKGRGQGEDNYCLQQLMVSYDFTHLNHWVPFALPPLIMPHKSIVWSCGLIMRGVCRSW